MLFLSAVRRRTWTALHSDDRHPTFTVREVWENGVRKGNSALSGDTLGLPDSEMMTWKGRRRMAILANLPWQMVG